MRDEAVRRSIACRSIKQKAFGEAATACLPGKACPRGTATGFARVWPRPERPVRASRGSRPPTPPDHQPPFDAGTHPRRL